MQRKVKGAGRTTRAGEAALVNLDDGLTASPLVSLRLWNTAIFNTDFDRQIGVFPCFLGQLDAFPHNLASIATTATQSAKPW
jgi:hypothetical protein